MTYEDIIEASKILGIPVNKILEVFYLLRNSEVIDNYHLIRTTGISRNVLNLLKKTFSFMFNPTSAHTSLTKTASYSLNEILDSQYQSESTILDFLDKELNHINDLVKVPLFERPTALREFDQFTATIETTKKRTAILNFFCDIKGKKILFIGDDDLTSIFVASLRSATEIVVIDIDVRILDTIKKISKEMKLKIKTIQCDLREKLPQELFNSFDIIFTDPPYTTEGIKLFVSRAIQGLNKDNKAARIYFCYGNSDRAKERYLEIYKIIFETGLMIRWIFDRFNRYNGAESIGSASMLFICEVTPQTHSIIKGDYKDVKLYTY